MAGLALQVGLHLALELFAGLAEALEALASEDICPYILAMRIDWDPIKAAANLREHKVSFAEAATVQSDEFALT